MVECRRSEPISLLDKESLWGEVSVTSESDPSSIITAHTDFDDVHSVQCDLRSKMRLLFPKVLSQGDDYRSCPFV